MYLGCLCVCCLPVCCLSVCVYHQNFCPLTSVESFGDIAIIFSQQLGIVALKR